MRALLSDWFTGRCRSRSLRRTFSQKRWRRFPGLALFLLAAFVTLRAGAAPIQYERDVAPILRTYCAGCHNDADREGNFSVETFTSLRKGGDEEGDPIQPGKAETSFLIRSIEHRSTPKMPPKDEPQVPAADIALLKKWIAAGAAGPREDVSILQRLVVAPLPAGRNVHRPATAVAASTDGKWLAVGRHARVEFRDAANGSLLHEITGLPGKVNSVRFTKDGSQIVIGTGVTGLNGVARLHDAATGALVREFAAHRDILFAVAFSPDDSTLATSGYDRSIKLWRVADGSLIRSMDVHTGAVFDLAFSPDGRALASASADQTIKLWRVADGMRLDTLNQPQGEMMRVAFTPDGRHILGAGADKRIYLWRWVSKDKPALNPLVQSRFAHDTAIGAMALTSDGKHLFTASNDRVVKLWSVPDLSEEHAFAGQSDVVSVMSALPNKPAVVAARMDGSVEILPVLAAEKEDATPPVQNAVAAAPVSAAAPMPAEPSKLAEQEPNGTAAQGQWVTLPAEITGAITRADDADVFRFTARAGEEFTFQVNAARSKSRLDSRLEVLHADGSPVEQTVLQAVRESWFTFRGKDADTSDDFRLHDWQRMELNEYLYANGEVVKLWLYPRGPDSGFKVYPGEGKRRTEFGTTPLAHALGQPCYVVRALPPGARPVPNGLPVYRLNCVNDDDPLRRWGADSEILFTAPATGDYLLRLTDVRGFGGETNFHYTLVMRDRRPGFTVTLAGKNPKISPGSGKELTVTALRTEGFDGAVRVDISNLPPGFQASTPVEIEAGQASADFVVWAEAGAMNPGTNEDRAVRVTATAMVEGRKVVQQLGDLGDLQLGDAPKVTLEILAGSNTTARQASPESPLEFFIRPGETISASVRATRNGFKQRIELGKDDSGRNLPHGVFVDNIGLNGLLIVESQSERDFVITAAPVVRPMTRLFHLKTTADGGQTSKPAILHVLPRESARTAQAQ